MNAWLASVCLPCAGEEENEDPREARIRQIEAQFAAARAPPVHCKDPSLRPLEILPGVPISPWLDG